MNAGLGWLKIMRLGLVQASLGALVVLTTSTMNRVMVVELALPAMLPGALVALHYALQALRPRWGYGSDLGGRRTPWIVGGVGLLALGCVGAALAIWLMAINLVLGAALAVICFALIGVGVGAAGTSLLALLAAETAPERRAAAATIVWIMMIFGFVVTTVSVGHWLDPYTPERLLAAASCVAAAAIIVSALAMWRIEPPRRPFTGRFVESKPPAMPFHHALADVWSEAEAPRFTIFIFVSMLAYSAEELILDPFSGAIFGYSPGASTKLSGVLHGGVLAGMILVALAGSGFAGKRLQSLRGWSIGGCIGSALALISLVFAALSGGDWPLRTSAFALGMANGAFSIAAIGSMMSLAGLGRPGREGVRMGLWGAAQGLAFGLGGLCSAGASDFFRAIFASQGSAYALVFAAEAVLFLFAAAIAASLQANAPGQKTKASGFNSFRTLSGAAPRAVNQR
ncbi:PUCC protein [Methylocella silvestris BL2]|uniref:PUCC protein n=1 Tax=Methylocella silvestris (strain DSM 15510 / CIP 108128 / LMG 27833 / NCIMB 13906 / BL2) TaxID=395965 RepID=B8EPZ8_METSB|nr:BCD family MFS transporter [Methylocella silvestris]ACK51002.1 PUCC protein [Methylocella silvestris BL2]